MFTYNNRKMLGDILNGSLSVDDNKILFSIDVVYKAL